MSTIATRSPTSFAAPARAATTPGLVQRIVSTIADARARRLDRDVERFIAERGGRLTDDLEREIGRRFG